MSGIRTLRDTYAISDFFTYIYTRFIAVVDKTFWLRHRRGVNLQNTNTTRVRTNFLCEKIKVYIEKSWETGITISTRRYKTSR